MFNYQKIVADAGYESEENYVYLSKHNQTSYIKPQNYEQLKKKQQPYSRYNFRRFLTRGKSNVVTEMFLLCLAYNIKKYNHKQRDKRTKTYLLKKTTLHKNQKNRIPLP